jgi:Tat protein translocase TatB subunit
MFDLGWMELVIIGITALIVVGPKDLPIMFKKVGIFVGKAKKMAREFRSTMESAADETGLKETANMLNVVKSSSDPKKLGDKIFSNEFEKIAATTEKETITPQDSKVLKSEKKEIVSKRS